MSFSAQHITTAPYPLPNTNRQKNVPRLYATCGGEQQIQTKRSYFRGIQCCGLGYSSASCCPKQQASPLKSAQLKAKKTVELHANGAADHPSVCVKSAREDRGHWQSTNWLFLKFNASADLCAPIKWKTSKINAWVILSPFKMKGHAKSTIKEIVELRNSAGWNVIENPQEQSFVSIARVTQSKL